MANLKKQREGKKTVAICGMAVTSRDKAPWNDKEVDIWVLNESHAHNYIKRLSRIFQLHPEWDYMRRGNFNDPFYPEFLQNLPWSENDIEQLKNTNTYKTMPRGWPKPKAGEKRRPDDLEIVLLEPSDKVKAKQTIFPFKEIMDSWKNNKNMRYFTSSAPFMIALAIHEGYERIEIYGFEMSSREEYAYQKPCMEFWLGVAMGKDIEVYLPPGCALLGETTKLYGYDKTPGYTAMHAEIRLNNLRREKEKAQVKFNSIAGRIQQLQADAQTAVQTKNQDWLNKIEKRLQAIGGERDKALAELNVMHGAFIEAERIWKDIQNLPSSENVRPIIPGHKVK
jgi:hypothetical protein